MASKHFVATYVIFMICRKTNHESFTKNTVPNKTILFIDDEYFRKNTKRFIPIS